jgi:hypothetical protein
VIFRTHPDGFWGTHSLLYDWYRVSFPGVRRPEAGVDHPSPSSVDVKKRVECTSTPLLGLNEFTITFMPRGLTLLAQRFYARMYLFVLVCPQDKQRFLSIRSLTKIFIIDI